LFKEGTPDLALVLVNLAEAACAQGNPAEGESLFREALDVLRRKADVDAIEMIPVLVGLAEACAAQGDFAEARSLAREAVEQARKAPEEVPSLLGGSLASLGKVHQAAGEAEEAEARYRQPRKTVTVWPGTKAGCRSSPWTVPSSGMLTRARFRKRAFSERTTKR
jgi:tetratricopeptide (TPR) repeat protein